MPFSSMAKEELAHLEAGKKCCELAELSSLIRVDGVLHIHKRELSLSTSSDNAAVARVILRLSKKLFQLDTELALSQVSRLDRRRRHVIYIPSQPRLLPAIQKMGILDDKMRINQGIPQHLVRSNCCIASYLRGAFLAGGSISEPKRGHHLEISTTNLTFAEDLVSLFERRGIPAKINARKKDYAVYFKDADRIGDFLALIGAHNTRLEWENLHIVRLLRNEVNRIVNCETANLSKAAKAAVKQIHDINLINEQLGLRNLSPSLKEIAHVRLKHPFSSLKELGEAIDPPLSKVAVAHRIRRLSQLATRLNVKV